MVECRRVLANLRAEICPYARSLVLLAFASTPALCWIGYVNQYDTPYTQDIPCYEVLKQVDAVVLREICKETTTYSYLRLSQGVRQNFRCGAVVLGVWIQEFPAFRN